MKHQSNEALLFTLVQRWNKVIYGQPYYQIYIRAMEKQDAQRTTQERHRRLRNAKDCACRYHSPTPQIFDRLELLNQQLNYALPVGIISQAIITTDNYLGYSLSHYLFSGKRTAAFRSLDDISLWIEKGSLRQLIVDMEALPVSCIEALNQLRALSWQQSDIQIYLLVSDKTPL